MLVLTRKIDQGIIISDNIYIKVLGVERDRVKIGISAPKETIVLREELVARDKVPGRNSGDPSDAPPVRTSTSEQPPASDS